MTEQRIEKPELVARVAARTQADAGTVEQILGATLEEIYQTLKQGESVSLRNFGTFYVREERSSWVFRFNWIAIGQDDFSHSMVRALDIGGLIWGGKI